MIVGIDASRANLAKKSGTEWYAFSLIQEMKKIAPSDVEFVLYSKTPLAGELKKLPHNFRNKVLAWPPKFLWTQLRLSLEMLFYEPDVLFVPAHTIPLIHPKNTINTIHDIGFERYSRLYSQEKIGPRNFLRYIINILVRLTTLGKYGASEFDYHRFSARFALKHAKTIIVPSQFTKAEIVKTYHIDSSRIVLIPNGYDDSKFKIIQDKTAIAEVLQRYNITRPFILSIGRLEEKKNTKGMVEAFGMARKMSATLAPYQLVLVGEPGYGYAAVERTIEQYHLKSDVLMPGWIPEDELPYLLNAAALFVFPSFYEGFGIPIIQAMACGTPVITSNVASMPEVAASGAYLVDPYNVKAISKAIVELAENHHLRNSLIQHGFERSEQFSWRKTAEATLKLILETTKKDANKHLPK